MGSVDAELLTSLLLLPQDMAIEGVSPSKTHLMIKVVCTLQSASCPPLSAIFGADSRQVWTNGG